MGSIFLLVGQAKLAGGPAIDTMFEAWGYPAEFRYVVGVLEAVGGIGLFIPATKRYASVLLMIVMTGAMLTHAVNAEYARIMINVVFGVLLFLLFKSWETDASVQASAAAQSDSNSK